MSWFSNGFLSSSSFLSSVPSWHWTLNFTPSSCRRSYDGNHDLVDYRYSGQTDDHCQDYYPRNLKPATVFVQPHHHCRFATPDGRPCDDFRPSGGEHSFSLAISYGMAMSVRGRSKPSRSTLHEHTHSPGPVLLEFTPYTHTLVTYFHSYYKIIITLCSWSHEK